MLTDVALVYEDTSSFTLNEFGLFTGSILLCAVLTISNAKLFCTKNDVLKEAIPDGFCAAMSMV